jgi:single-stranded-DNA-specific exonuclease
MSRAERLSLTDGRWVIGEPDAAVVAGLTAALGVGALAARALACRGIGDPDEAQRFLHPDFRNALDPDLMQDVGRAVDLIEKALSENAPIRIYGDYDVDGVCATALMVRALGALGGHVDWYVPHRVEEGYGLNAEAVRRAAEEGVKLLITVDCGASAVEEVALARRLGMEVIVTDHHQPGPALPEAPVLDPWRPTCRYPFKDLAGVGVAFKLVTAVARRLGIIEGKEANFLDLVCLGTVGDVVPLLGENRLFVQQGLQQLPRSRKLGLSALIRAADLGGKVNSRHVAFALAPRINAVGRMEHARDAVNLLLTTDPAEARALAEQLSALNERRRQHEQRALSEAEAMIAEEVDLDRELAIVLAREGWHPGVIGIVASRLVERYHRPVLLVALEDDVGKGSGRSIASLNLWEALCECAPVLIRFGGHHYAAGFSVAREKVPELRRRLNETASRLLTPADLVRQVETDGEVGLGDLSQEAVQELGLLAPFGMANPEPLFVTRRLRVCEATPVGGGNHLSLRFADESGHTIGAIWFRGGSLCETLRQANAVDVCHRPQLDEWNGSVRVRLVVEDIALRDDGGGALGRPGASPAASG